MIVLFIALSLTVLFCKGYFWNLSLRFPLNIYIGFFMSIIRWAHHLSLFEHIFLNDSLEVNIPTRHVPFQNWGLPISFCFFLASTKTHLIYDQTFQTNKIQMQKGRSHNFSLSSTSEWTPLSVWYYRFFEDSS